MPQLLLPKAASLAAYTLNLLVGVAAVAAAQVVWLQSPAAQVLGVAAAP
jgi:hypothetical protein